MARLGRAIAATIALSFFAVAAAVPVQAASTPTLTVSPTAAIVGAKVTVTGQGFPASSSLALEWSTINGSWDVAGNPPQVAGINAVPYQMTLATVQTDGQGSFTTSFTVPSDYGGKHTLQTVASNGTALTGRAIFTLEPSFTFSPSSGPAGTPITVVATGLGYGSYSTSYHLYWDNSYTGYFTAISTGGATNFTFYASGVVGTHYLEIYQGYPGPGYLNPQEGPPSSETQSVFPPYIPFHGQFNVTSTGATGLAVSGSGLVTMLGLAALSMTAVGLSVAVSRPGRRRALASSVFVVVVVAIIAVAGVTAYLVFSPGSAASTPAFTPVATVVRPTITVQQAPVVAGPTLTVSPDIASVGQTVTVTGSGFAANAVVPVTWSTQKGNNLHGYQAVAQPLRSATAGADGSFSFTMTVPADLGGAHYIASANLTQNTATLFLQRTASINATQGPAGSTIAVSMVGVGWTFNTNIEAIDYDNSYLGYGCGFNSGGNVTFYVTLTGAPGVHTIDLYPSVWWGTSNYYNKSVVEYRYPLMTPQDHPELMPSFHFTVLITAPGQQAQSTAAVISPAGALGVMGLALPAALNTASSPTDEERER